MWAAVAALRVPQEGIVDYAAVCDTLAAKAHGAGRARGDGRARLSGCAGKELGGLRKTTAGRSKPIS